MKVVILAGGLGTRISEESHLKPKPMIEIGDKPILWHIMRTYSYYGHNEFIICCGYKGYLIKEYFANYFLYMSDITFDFTDKNKMIIHNNVSEPWKVTLVDTGLHTATGGRIKKIKHYVENEQSFMLTYGDGVSDVNIPELIDFHNKNGKIATVTAVQPLGKFGALEINNDLKVDSFKEKIRGDGGWVSGGFFVLNKEIYKYLDRINENTSFESLPLEWLSKDSQLMAYKHYGFWHPMDTMRDKETLNNLWESNNAPWKVW